MTQDSENTNNSKNNKPSSETAAEDEWNQAGDTQPRPATKDAQERHKRNTELSNDRRPVAKTMIDQDLPVPEPAGRRHDRPDVPKTMLDHNFFGAHFKDSFKKEEEAAKPVKAPINLPSSQPAAPMPEEVHYQSPSQPVASRSAPDNKPSSIMNPLTISGILLLIACIVSLFFLPKSPSTSGEKPAAGVQPAATIESGSKPSSPASPPNGISIPSAATTSATSGMATPQKN